MFQGTKYQYIEKIVVLNMLFHIINKIRLIYVGLFVK